MKYEKEFIDIIIHIINGNNFVKMKKYRHHVKSNIYDHSIKVAYYCYKHYKRFKLKGNILELLRGALLHDYYLYDWHDRLPENKFHGFRHPKRALKNALRDFPDLSSTEIDIIKHHMFPLTLSPPRSFYGWLVCFYDKIAAIGDYLSIKKSNNGS